MHLYMRAVGFSNLFTKKELKTLMNDILIESTEKDFLETDRKSVIVEYSKDYSPSCGVTLRGEYDDDNNLTLDYYFPYVRAEKVSTCEDIVVERHAQNESFAAVCDDYRVGVSVMYYVQNGMTVMRQIATEETEEKKCSSSLSALSLYGMIMLPIQKDQKTIDRSKKAAIDRSKRIVAAKAGDEEAIEKLTLEDIDTYTAVSKRVLTDDIYTLVDSFFMPYGVECDMYSIMGDIESFTEEENRLTKEKLYVMDISCNGLPIRVCINKEDLLGEPGIGRRFKGNVWLQGKIAYL